MDSFSITLNEGKEKKYTTPSFIPGNLFRQAGEIAKEFESGSKDLEKHYQFVCEVFGNQFNVEQFENGNDARKIMRIVYATVHFVIGNIELANNLVADEENK